MIFDLSHHELRFITALRNVHGVLFCFPALLGKIGNWFIVFSYQRSQLPNLYRGRRSAGLTISSIQTLGIERVGVARRIG